MTVFEPVVWLFEADFGLFRYESHLFNIPRPNHRLSCPRPMTCSLVRKRKAADHLPYTV